MSIIKSMTNPLNPGEYLTTLEVTADESGKLPTIIDILRPIKVTKSPSKPAFEVNSSDLHEYASNFGLRKGVPVDIEHGQDPKHGKEAGGWLKRLFVEADEKGDVLRGEVDWNHLGSELVADKRYRFISPQFVPRSLGAYEDPETGSKHFNVLKAVTLTNMPFFKGLNPISASEDGEQNINGLTMYILPNTIKPIERAEMQIDQVRTKNPADLSADEKAFLTDHKSELSASELIGFGLDEKKVEVKPEVKADEKPEVKATDKVEISATELDAMKATIAALEVKANEGVEAAKTLKANEVSEFVATHVKRGAIKAGEAEATAKMILASEDAENMKTLIANLPDHVVAAGEAGESEKGTLGNAGATIEAKANEVLASEAGKSLTYAEAVKRAISQNPELSKEYVTELEGR